MGKVGWIVGVLCLMGLTVNAQRTIDWDFLMNVKFEAKYYEEVGESLWFPTFSEEVKAVEGVRVRIEGYVIPIDLESDLYVLSAYPFAACFFCGNAGPESVMALEFAKRPRRFDNDEVVVFEGILRLNDSDINELNYILEKCREVEAE